MARSKKRTTAVRGPVTLQSGQPLETGGEVTAAQVEDVGYWSPLTNGDPAAPALIFNGDGDVIMTWTTT